MDNAGNAGPARLSNNKSLVEILLSEPAAARTKGKGGGRQASEMTFEDRMAEAAELLAPSQDAVVFGGSQAAQASENPDASGQVAGDVASMTSDDILAYASGMLQKKAGAGSMRITSISVDIEITEIMIQNGQGDGQQVNTADPVVLDLNRDGRISMTTAEDGVRFDITGDGRAEQTAFVSEGDGVLALDRDGDGRITSGLELFGDQHGSADGFLELGKFDDNGDGVINSSDSVFSKLSVMTRSADGSLNVRGLAEYGISQLNLANTSTCEAVEGGSFISATSTAVDSQGRQMLTADANFAYIA